VTFLAPAFLFAAALAALAVVAIHFIVTREPRMVPLPTARFAPARPVRARARALRPQDLLLLLLRVLLLLAVGAALAQPILRPQQRALVRILLVDRSRAVDNAGEVADSARALFSQGDAIVLFDSAASVVLDGGADSLAALARIEHRGRLSPALIAALRTASAIRERADSLELAIISPLLAEEADYATESVRALWPGAVRLVRVAARPDTAPPASATVDGDQSDPLRVALPTEDKAARAASRIVRGPLAAADYAWVESGGAIIHWPATDGRRDSPRLAAFWAHRQTPDTVGAVIAGDIVVVAPFERRFVYRAGPGATGVRVVARWVDGEPAAVEEPRGAGCIRTVMVDVPSRGDLVLEPRFARLVAALVAPCGPRPALDPLDGPRLASLAGADSLGYAASSELGAPESVRLPLVPWLLAAALLFAAAALMLRRRIARSASRVEAA
jgi:hypothetical protein